MDAVYGVVELTEKRISIRTLRICIPLVLLWCVGYCVAVAQSLNGWPSVSEHAFHSTALNEKRSYWIALPEDDAADHTKSKQYPVIYVLDGEKYFSVVVGVLDFLTNGNRSRYPKCIVVGIVNTNRTRDFTPTAAESGRGRATLTNSGGGSNFARFVVNELIPDVEKKWNASDRRMIIGHSFGGLEAAYILLHYPAFFSDYLLFDPSLWWDDFTLLKQGDKLMKSTILPHTGKTVFVSHASSQAQSPYQQDLDFSGRLKEELPADWRIETNWYESETHGSLFVPALYDGLRMVLR